MGEKQREAMHKKVFEKGYIPTSLHFHQVWREDDYMIALPGYIGVQQGT